MSRASPPDEPRPPARTAPAGSACRPPAGPRSSIAVPWRSTAPALSAAASPRSCRCAHRGTGHVTCTSCSRYDVVARSPWAGPL